jgi:phosphatidylglycerol---prolipoprotein diacylglyceryl transferase
MTFPVAIPFGPLRLHPHLVFEALGYALGFRLFLRLRGGVDPLTDVSRYSVVAGAAVGAALGSKMLHWLHQPSLTLAHWNDPIFLMGGKSIVGGLLGGVLGVEWVKQRLGESRSTGDLFVLPLCLGMAVGRVGCFLTGLADHTFGVPTTLPWGVDFGDGVPRHPTQLYEIVALGAIAAWALTRRKRAGRSGDLFRGFMVLYLAFRFFVELIKPDAGEYLGLTGIQVASLAGLAYYLPTARRALFGGGEAIDG